MVRPAVCRLLLIYFRGSSVVKVPTVMRALVSRLHAGSCTAPELAARVLLFAGVVALVGGWAGAVVGQESTGDAGKDEATVTLNFQQEVPIQALVDYVSQRLGIKILYDADLVSANKKISVKAPGSIPVGSLLPLLESALKMGDFALVEAEAPQLDFARPSYGSGICVFKSGTSVGTCSARYIPQLIAI